MNQITNKFLLAGDTSEPEFHLTQTGFTYSACGLFSKHCERILKVKETGESKHIYKNELE